jgi:hypothetical protein
MINHDNIKKVVLVCLSAMMRRDVENQLKKHRVYVVPCDKPSQLNGQLEPRKDNLIILLLLTGQEDACWNTIQLNHFCSKTDKLLVRSSNNMVGLYSRLLALGADKILKRDEDVWKAIQKLFGSE